MSRMLLVELEPDLDQSERAAAWNWIMLAPAVRSLTDMEDLSPQTYEQWMLPRQLALDVGIKRERKPKR